MARSQEGDGDGSGGCGAGHPDGELSTLEVAQSLLAQGLVPLPIVPGRKVPMEREWTKKPVPTAADLQRWFGGEARANIGIRAGRISALLVLDVDTHKGGDAGLDALVEKHGPLPDTVMAMTPSGGYHYYFALPDTLSVGNSVCKLGAGLDIRADGGQVLCYPSVIDGKRYEWDGGEVPRRADIAPLPTWLAALVTDARRTQKANHALPEEEKRAVIYAAGGRNDALFRIAGSMRARGMAEEAILSALVAENAAHCMPPLGEDEVARIAASAARYEPSPAHLEMWKEGLHVGRSGKYKGTMSNVRLILANDPRLAGTLAYDELAGAVVTVRPTPWKKTPGALGDNDLACMRGWLCNAVWSGYDIDECSQTAALEAVNLVADDQHINPLTDWLNGLRWDGVERIDHLLADAWGIEESPYHSCVSRVLTICAVQRALRPGCKMDLMPIIEGAQGIYKSTFLSALYSPWFAEKSTPSFEGATPAMEVAGYWCVEVAELNAFTRGDVNAIKGFLSRKVDVYRPPYGRHTVATPRRCLLVGTTNDQSYLQDQTGNRRFLPVRVTQDCNLEYVMSAREQLFAEAMARIDELIIVDGEAAIGAAAAQEYAVAGDPWTDLIEEWLTFCVVPRITSTVVFEEALKMEPSKRTRRDEMRVGQCLATLGYERTRIRVGERRLYVYTKTQK